MQRTMQYILLVAGILAVAMANANTAGSSSSSGLTRSEYPRPNRGFKSAGLSTARGFGKRDPGLAARGTFIGSPGPIVQPSQTNFDSSLPINFDTRTSYPNSWLIEEMQNNPDTARLIVEKFVDENGDGELTPEELYRRVFY